MRLRELTELCEGCVNVRGCVECNELLKANDRVLLTLGTFVHVLSEHSVLCLVFFLCTLTVFLFQQCRKKLLLLIDHRYT